jgi:hypothetical protein
MDGNGFVVNSLRFPPEYELPTVILQRKLAAVVIVLDFDSNVSVLIGRDEAGGRWGPALKELR